MKKKLAVSLLVLFVGVAAYSSLFDRMVAASRVDARASGYLDESLLKALKTYAIVRGLNAVVSVAQDTDLSFSPAGVGVTTGLGEVFDPLNDLLERFSWVMLMSTASFGVQKVLLEAGTWLGLKHLLAAAMILVLAGLWVPRQAGANLASVGYKLVLVSLIIRFGIPAAAHINDRVYDLFLNKMYVESTRLLDKTKQEIADDAVLGSRSRAGEGDKSILDSLKETMDVPGKIAALKEKAASAVGHAVNLIVVFLVQTVVIPLLTLWALVKLLDYIVASNVSAAIGEKLMDLKGRA